MAGGKDMGRELQAMNHSNQVSVWTQRVEDCRSSNLTISEWCEAQNSNFDLLRMAAQTISNPTGNRIHLLC